jgi:hypothetical protein
MWVRIVRVPAFLVNTKMRGPPTCSGFFDKTANLNASLLSSYTMESSLLTQSSTKTSKLFRFVRII